MHIFCIVNVFYPFNRGLDTFLCIVSVFYPFNGGLDIRGRELLLGYPPVSASVNSKKDHNVNGNNDNDEAIVMMISFDHRKCQF